VAADLGAKVQHLLLLALALVCVACISCLQSYSQEVRSKLKCGLMNACLFFSVVFSCFASAGQQRLLAYLNCWQSWNKGAAIVVASAGLLQQLHVQRHCHVASHQLCIAAVDVFMSLCA